MKCRRGVILVCISLGYGLISLYTAYTALSRTTKTWSRVSLTPHSTISSLHHEEVRDIAGSMNILKHSGPREIIIWDTCGLGIYLWRNILHGKITRYNLINGWTHDSLEIDGLQLKYNLGYGLPPSKAMAANSPNLVLIINGRSEAQMHNAKAWLDHALKSAYIDQVAVMLLGSETCDNEWILPYLQQTRVKCLFLVYDSPLIDDELVYQWPLGVASYRNFHNYGEEFLDLTAHRKYVFNFVGTVYEETSRVDMMSIIKRIGNDTKRFVKTRNNWIEEETTEDMAVYQHALLESDLTLSPVGFNSECYRTYEALEMGSIPVIEDVLTEGTCGDYDEENSRQVNYTPPYRLLKHYGAPMLYVKNWEELPGVVKRFADMPQRTKFYHRINLIRWYVDFKNTMKKKFLSVIVGKFFPT